MLSTGLEKFSLRAELGEEESRRLIASANFIQDGLFKLYFEDIPALQEFLRVQLQDPDLDVVKISTEKEMPNFYGRDISVDVLCKDKDGRYIDVEMQCNIGAINHVKRVVYYAASILTHYAIKGDENFSKIPKVVVLYITLKDFLKTGRSHVRSKTIIDELNRPLDTGVEFVFANLEIKDGSDASHMLEMLQTCEKNKRFPAMSNRIHYLTETEQGELKMYEMNNEAWKKGVERGKEREACNSIRALMKNKGWSMEEAMSTLDIPSERRAGYAEKLKQEGCF